MAITLLGAFVPGRMASRLAVAEEQLEQRRHRRLRDGAGPPGRARAGDLGVRMAPERHDEMVMVTDDLVRHIIPV